VYVYVHSSYTCVCGVVQSVLTSLFWRFFQFTNLSSFINNGDVYPLLFLLHPVCLEMSNSLDNKNMLHVDRITYKILVRFLKSESVYYVSNMNVFPN